MNDGQLNAAPLDRILNAGDLPWNEAVVSDLSLGAWMPFAVARDISCQLGVCVPLPSNKKLFGFSKQIAQFVDSETAGDTTCILASRLSRTIASKMRSNSISMLIIVAPIRPSQVGRDNIEFIRALAAVLPELRFALLSYTGGSVNILADANVDPVFAVQSLRTTTPHLDSIVGVPGVLPNDLATQSKIADLGGARALRSGAYLLPGEYRAAFVDAGGTNIVYSIADHAISTAVQLRQEFYKSNPNDGLLRELAFLNLSAGSWELADKAMLRAREATVGTPAEWLNLLQHQGMRIALELFDEVVSEPLPPKDTDPQMRGFLILAKAWGLVMKRRPHLAEPFFEEARLILPKYVDTESFCWILNISALNILRLGDVSGALQIETIVRREINRRSLSPQLDYINGLNLGRLYRRLNDFASAGHFFHTAFATTVGCASAADHVLREFSAYQNYLGLGQPAEAFWALTRAAAFWVSAEVPEAIAARVVRIITRSTVIPRMVRESMAGAFVDYLLQFSGIAEFKALMVDNGSAPLAFCARDREDTINAAAVFGDDQFGAILVHGIFPAPSRGERWSELVAILSNIIRTVWNTVVPENSGGVVIDDLFGVNLPRSRNELLGLAVRAGAREICFAQRCVALGDRTVRDLERSMRLRVAKSVSKWEIQHGHIRVSFLRYRDGFTLAVDEECVFRAALENQRIDEIIFAENAIPIARRLEKAGVVKLELDQTAVCRIFGDDHV
jgi:hypothetical protein